MILSIIIAKLVALVLRIFHRGATTLPGRIALKIKPNILFHLSRGVHSIIVTGTNGKTTTCALIESVLKSNGYSYFINKSGANMMSGIVTAFITNSTFLGKCKKEYAILECDENSLPRVSTFINADYVIVTNIFRDQLDRYGEVNYTLSQIKKGVGNMHSTLILNADCPLTSSIGEGITYGINMAYKNDIVSDNRYCPVCNNELKYNSTVYAQLGDYYCNCCGYSRNKPDYAVTNITENSITINGEMLSLAINGIYNVYNYLSAYTLCKTIGITNFDGLYTFSGAFGRMEMFHYKDKNILVLLVKNPVGMSNCIDLVARKNGRYNIVFALNDNAADGIDISWIWDVKYSSIKDKISTCYTIGTRSYDMALRLKYDGISSVITDGEEYSKMIDIIKSSNEDIIILSTYTSMMNMRHYLVDEFGGDEFWQ